MARRNKTIATIRCQTELGKLNRIAQESGLIAERADTADRFHLVNSGRYLAVDLQPELWEQARAKLDEAVRAGAIPAWSAIHSVANG